MLHCKINDRAKDACFLQDDQWIIEARIVFFEGRAAIGSTLRYAVLGAVCAGWIMCIFLR